MTYYDDNIEENNDAALSSEEELSPAEEVVVEQAESESQTTVPVKADKSSKKSKKGAGKVKGTVSELKKVSWLGFGKVVKQTIVVLAVTAVFLVVIMGIDQLLYLLYNLITKNM